MKQLLADMLFGKEVTEIGPRVSDSNATQILLNRNEFPIDLPESMKDEILNKLKQQGWNRYPMVRNEELITLLAKYNEVSPKMICPGAGAAMIATSLINYFALKGREMIILQPSFSLYEYHCKSYGIPYKPWTLNTQLEFDETTLPVLSKKSVVLLATPNNPTGSVLSQTLLSKLLSQNPEALFIVDEVYHEFCDINNTKLLETYKNLILLRSFSKSFMTAGIRFGYCIAPPELREQIEKIVLPFSINHFAANTAIYLLKNNTWLDINKQNLAQIAHDRQKMFMLITKLNREKNLLKIFVSEGNFLLFKIKNTPLHKKILQLFEEAKIAILDTSKQPLINDTIRITIGNEVDNQRVFEVFKQFFKQN